MGTEIVGFFESQGSSQIMVRNRTQPLAIKRKKPQHCAMAHQGIGWDRNIQHEERRMVFLLTQAFQLIRNLGIDREIAQKNFFLNS